MKAIWCDDCRDLVVLRKGLIRECSCGAHAGTYLSDNITAVISKEAFVVGLDNNSFLNAVASCNWARENVEHRVDYFFCGWIPNIPGEVIYVDTVEDVHNFKEDENTELTTTSTMPTSA